jgi:hypothetical protein
VHHRQPITCQEDKLKTTTQCYYNQLIIVQELM